jgi:hypothetical protein
MGGSISFGRRIHIEGERNFFLTRQPLRKYIHAQWNRYHPKMVPIPIPRREQSGSPANRMFRSEIKASKQNRKQ